MFIRSFVFILATLVVLFVISPILAITTFVGIGPIVVFSVKYGYKMKDVAKAVSGEKGKMSSIADESLGNIRTVKAFSNEDEEIRKFTQHSIDVYKLGLTKAYWTGLFGFFV